MRILKRIYRRCAVGVYRLGPGFWSLYPGLFGRLVSVVDRRVALLYALHATQPTIRFIQIGSNDADAKDPLSAFLRSQKWGGVMVDPVKYVFERLVRNHQANPNLIFENVAVAAERGIKPFYYLKETTDDVPTWYDQLGSFSMDVVLRHESTIPDIRQRIVAEEVQCLTFEDLCQKHNLREIDVVHIDTEGYDLEILRLIDFGAHQPQIVIFEHKHLSESDQARAHQILEENGYVHGVLGNDTAAVSRQTLSRNAAVRREWQRLPKGKNNSLTVNSTTEYQYSRAP
jgi:FkbM family methyltransferase